MNDKHFSKLSAGTLLIVADYYGNEMMLVTDTFTSRIIDGHPEVCIQGFVITHYKHIKEASKVRGLVKWFSYNGELFPAPESRRAWMDVAVIGAHKRRKNNNRTRM